MTNLREIYRCEVCGNTIEVVMASQGELVCCGKPMTKMGAKTQDDGNEKHVPIIEEVDGGIKVKVGSIEHPMEEKHYIQFIEVLTKDKVCRAELKPGQKPETSFCCLTKADIVEVKELCNIHGLWKA